jgi:aminopeptidase N
VEDFVRCFEDATGRDLDQFMSWYNQAGTPELVCQLKYDQRTKTAELTVTQVLPPTPGQPKKKPLHIPFRVGLVGGNGQDLELTLASGQRVEGGLLEIRKRTETFRFRDVPSRPIPSLLRSFSAPVNLTIELSDSDLQFLMANDSDLYNRWHAAQDYATRVLKEGVKAIRSGKRPARPLAFVAALGATLQDESLEPGYRAQFIMLPTEADLARMIGQDIDPLAIYKARLHLRKAIGTMLHGALADIYERYAVKGAYAPSPEQVGRRALRNAALGYLACRGGAGDIARTAAHFSRARNATDEIAALAILSEQRWPERDKAFDAFYERWKNDHLVIDSWFAFQAVSPLPSTMATVRKLTRHPLFSLQNPNKVRAVIGTFASANQVNFNRLDGRGYDFVADHVLKVDAFNPQIAARLLSAFRSWNILEPKRRRLAKKALQRVAKVKPLSHDVFEIVSKMLE